MQKLTPCLWFDTEGEEAAKLYTSIFPNSRITNVSHYGEAGPRDAGTVLTVEFELDGAVVHRAERRAELQVQRGDLVPGQLRGPGRGRPLLGGARRGR